MAFGSPPANIPATASTADAIRPLSFDLARLLEPAVFRRAGEDVLFLVEVFEAVPEFEDLDLEAADLPPALALEAVDRLPDFDPVFEPPAEPERDELVERELVLFLPPADLLVEGRLDDPPDDFADEDLDADLDLDPELDERDPLDPAFDVLDDPDFEDPPLADLDDPGLDDFDEPDFLDDEEPDFEPVDFLVVGIFVSSGITVSFELGTRAF
jgi:hypothetical protein